VWYPATAGARNLPFPSIMAMGNWDATGQQWLPGGEVDDANRSFNRKKEVPGAFGLHVCGTEEDFREGCKRTDVPLPVVYGASGLPNCCAPPVVGAGGLALSGRATVSVLPGPTCPLAPLIVSGVDYTGHLPSAGANWWRWAYTPGTNFDVPFSASASGPFTVMQVLAGDTCADATVRQLFFLSPPGGVGHLLATNFGPPNSFVWFLVDVGGPFIDYTFRVEPL